MFMCVKNNMRHDDRYSMVSERCVHVMAQHGTRKWKELTVVNKKSSGLESI